MNATAKQIAETRQELALIESKAELIAYTQALESLTTPERVVVAEGFGDIVDRNEHLYDDPYWFTQGVGYSRPGDRVAGDYYPYWRTETELAELRGICSNVAEADEVGVAALENLANYVLGRRGFEYTATAKVRADDALAAAVQALIDEHIDASCWADCLEREAFVRSHKEGEAFLAIEPTAGGRTQTTIIEPSHVTEPDNGQLVEDYYGLSGSIEWKYGVAKRNNRPAQRFGYFVEHFGDAADWDFYTTDAITHIKRNVDNVVARGMSDFFPVYQDLQRAEKLLRNTAEGSAVQACIAFIKEGGPGVRAADLEATKTGSSALNWLQKVQKGDGTSRDVEHRKFMPGSVFTVKNGTKYHAGPLGQSSAPTYIDVVQALLRRAGVRWSMPEYMISGDASNGNFASTLVAESPFTKGSEHRQNRYGKNFEGHFWKVVGFAVRAGTFESFGVSTLRDLKRRVELGSKGPDIAVRDRLQEHQIRMEENAAGILSAETWAEEAGRDYAAEIKKGAAKQETAPAFESVDPIARPWLNYP